MLHQFRASDQTLLSYFDMGHGRPVLFQHGFAMDHRQILEIWPNHSDLRLICLDLRGHGFSETGPIHQLTFQRALQDLRELIEHINLSPTAIGGSSLGAALALELATEMEVEQLIISRPAFPIQGNTDHFDVFRALKPIIENEPKDKWLATLEAHPTFIALAETAPRNQETYRFLLEHTRLPDLIQWMEALDQHALTLSVKDLDAIRCKTDVIGQAQDTLHPLELAQWFSQCIPQAHLHQVASAIESDDDYRASMQNVLTRILSA